MNRDLLTPMFIPPSIVNFFTNPLRNGKKDRKGRVLSFEDILHYQKIIVALEKTNSLIKVIDKEFITT